ncbi:MAG TPA: glycyl-radical enzyme activating protein [Atribacteraceae bacterium]|nr:glycyl-radical enzyme activating protein [Atribacteraceae bacterium]
MKGLIFDIQHYSLQDGPGIRTTVFLKGCPLRCRWCHNPESQDMFPEIGFSENKCQRCGACEEFCPRKACSLHHPFRVDRRLCDVCGRCVLPCPSSALEIIGREVTVKEVVAEALKDEVFYFQSGGGVTISGGEPLRQGNFVTELLFALKALGYHLTLDTSGYSRGDESDLRQLLALAPDLDLILYDLKLIDEQKHREYVGVSNQTILENACILGVKYPHKVVFRYPLIPGLNDSISDIKALGTFLSRFPRCALEILPYHRLGVGKYRKTGRAWELAELMPPKEELVAQLKKELAKFSNVTVQ